MEADFVLIDRGVVHSTKRRRRQVFSGCVFWVVFNSIQFFFMKTTYSREPWHCGVQREERILHVFA